MALISCSDIEWKLLSDLIEREFGLLFDGVRQGILISRLATRLISLHLHSYGDYYRYVNSHPQRLEELHLVACTITNNESYFFREAHQFEILTKHVIPSILPRLHGDPIRILSAGCSSGEEPYSISILLQNAGFELRGYRWEIDACDINRTRLATAEVGIYDPYSLRTCDEEAKTRYFDLNEKTKKFALREPHKKWVRFTERNLAVENPDWPQGLYHAIFCRNVLIYFSERAFHNAISLFAKGIVPNGYLFLGHSESLIRRRSDFEPVTLDGSVIYQKTTDI